jgi:hypothetical protein
MARLVPAFIIGLLLSGQSATAQNTKSFTPEELTTSRLDLSLLIKGQLLSQEQDLRAQGCARAEQEKEEKKRVRYQIGDQDKQRIQ